MEYEEGDLVEVYIPDTDDVDSKYHRCKGEVVDVLEDDLSELTGNPEDDFLYTVDLEEDGTQDFRYGDLKELE